MKTRSDAALHALAWARIPGLTPRRLWRVLEAAGDWKGVAEADPDLLSAALGSEELAGRVRRPDLAGARAELDLGNRAGLTLLQPFEGTYPRLLREIADPPTVLWASGRLDRLELPAVAIVGARAATNYGREVAGELARDLSAAGLCVVSGMARGIDGAAHRAAAAEAGGTAAVLGCGPDLVYPPEHADLRRRIEESGVVLSEYAPGEPPRQENFPVRNRVIAGMSLAVIVVEAAARSGSLITARLATDFGRDVFAVPGSIRAETSSGCHALLREGAILCRGAEDVLSEIFPSVGVARREPLPPPDLPEDAGRVLSALLSGESLSPDDLADSTQIPAGQLFAILFDLESRGLARALPGGLYAALRDPRA